MKVKNSVQTHIFFLFLILIFPFFTRTIQAQQEVMYTQYMFNTLSFNPAYAGSKEYMSSFIIHRSQWLRWNSQGHSLNPELETGGAPSSQSFSIHTPVDKKIGLGLTVVNDKIGVTGSTSLQASYAYHIPFVSGKLSIAAQAGIFNYRADYNKLIARDPLTSDPAYNQGNPSIFRPNFGIGIYYYNPKYYIGVSVPRMIQTELRVYESRSGENTQSIAKYYPHFYLTTGLTIKLKDSENLILRPSFLLKSVGFINNLTKSSSAVSSIGAPNQFDIDLALFFHRKLWLGLGYRSTFEFLFSQISSEDSLQAWTQFVFKNGLNIGFSYDFSITTLNQYSTGSIEVSLGYDLNFSNNKTNSPRYF